MSLALLEKHRTSPLTSSEACAYNACRDELNKKCENIMTPDIIRHSLNIAPVMGYGYVGSRLYGLVDSKSDTDLAIITSGKAKATQKVMDDMDYRIYSIDVFLNRLQNTRMSETDLLMSGTMTMLDPTYNAYLNAFRVNSLEYIRQCEQHIHVAFKIVTPDIMTNHFQYKSLKSAVRCAILERKMEEQRGGFNPVFAEADKETYWNLVEEFSARIQNGEKGASLASRLHGKTRAIQFA